MPQDLRGLFERALDDEPVPPPGDPVGQAMARGRRIRRRRGLVAGGSAAVAVVAVLAALNVATAPAEPPQPAPAAAALETAPCAEPPEKADQVSIFLNQDITDSQRFNLDAALRAEPIVRNLRFESRDEAYRKFKVLWRDNPTYAAQVHAAATPEAFRVDLAEPSGYPEFAAKFQHQAGVQVVVGRPCPGTGK